MSTMEPASGQLIPINDCVLVELKQSYKNFSAKEGKYDTRTEGIVVRVPERTVTGTASGTITTSVGATFTSIPSMPLKDLVGKRVYFEEFKEGSRIKRDGKLYSFIKIEDIRGYESA